MIKKLILIKKIQGAYFLIPAYANSKLELTKLGDSINERLLFLNIVCEI